MLSLPRPPAWMAQAACAEIGASADFDLWYPERGGRYPEAERVCASCPVRLQCLDYGMDEVWGWWGGVSPLARAAMRQRRAGERAA